MKVLLLSNLFRLITSLLWYTIRIETVNGEYLEDFRNNRKGFILAFWHGEQFALTRYMRNLGLYILTSLSKDGELQTKYLTSLGYNCVRGSSSRGGMKAVIQLRRIVKNSDYAPVAMAVDGPKGPIYQPKDGFLYLSSKTGMPILPVRVVYHNAKLFKRSWDRYKLPKPFSKITVIFSEPYQAGGADDKEKERFREIMRKITETV
ncbi:MAG: lysophospholipid acyltransferase family protein [Candidatus Muiribacteriaceae bacterium]